MTKSASTWSIVFSIGLLVLAVAIGPFLVPVALAGEDTDLGFDPAKELAAEWLPEPYSVLAASAKDRAEMRKYTEHVRCTDDGEDDLTFDMVPIPCGTLLMGSPDDEAGRNDDEGPQVEVKIKPFWMMSTEVTWELFDTWAFSLDIQQRKAMKTEGSKWDNIADAVARPTPPYSDMTFEMGHDGYPAICMTQYSAKVFCKWLCAKTGRYYRLPTEAEWEHACRAGTTTAYSFGDNTDDMEDYVWYFDNCPDGYAKVGTKKPNPWGLYDMHGNVSEWVLDQHIPDYYEQLKSGKVDTSFAVPTEVFSRVVRGGSWYDDPEACRSASRCGSEEDWNMQDPMIPQSIWYHTDAIFVGFRVIRPLSVPTAEEAKLYEADPKVMEEYQESQGGKQ